MRVRLRRPGRGECGTWIVGGRLVGSGVDDPAYQLRQARSGRVRILRRSRLHLTRTSSRGGEPMPDQPQLSDEEAAQRRRAWLDGRRRWNRDLVVVLLRYAPEADIARALDRLSAGELQRLARLITQGTDLHQVARRIAIDLQEHLDGRPRPGAPRPAKPLRGDPDAP